MKKFWIDRPWCDSFAPLLAVAVWLAVPLGSLPDEVFAPALTMLSAAAGISLALVSINLSLAYRDDGPYGRRFRAKYGHAMRGLFIWPLVFLVGATLAPVAGLAFSVTHPAIATAVALGTGVLIAAVLLRLIWMLRVFLKLDEAVKTAERRAAEPTAGEPVPQFPVKDD